MEELTRRIQEARDQVVAHANEILGKAARDFARYPPEAQAKLLELMRTGWAIDPDQPLLFVRLMEGEFGGEAAAEAWVTGHYISRMGEIETSLAMRHPERAEIMQDAFDAHRRGAYSLSVPVFLTQADGIVGARYERTQLFSKSRCHGLASQLKEMEKGQLATMWAEILSGKAEISSNVRDLPENFSGLNRHAVLHGTDLGYGTEKNSLKAASMLYMASLLAVSNPAGVVEDGAGLPIDAKEV